jgi:hypothetical protein
VQQGEISPDGKGFGQLTEYAYGIIDHGDGAYLVLFFAKTRLPRFGSIPVFFSHIT